MHAETSLKDSHDCYRTKARRIFIMLNIDNTIVDRITKCDETKINTLQKMGIKSQHLQFMVTKETSPKFIAMYDKLSTGKKIENEFDYMSQISVEKLRDNEFRVTECLAIRPAAQMLLEQLSRLELPVVILITSRNDDTRTQNLQKNLELEIGGKQFHEVTKFIPRDWFRVKVTSSDSTELSVKSSIELRKHYPEIGCNDFVILLDHLESSRFIKYNNLIDLNIQVSKFYPDKHYDLKQESKEVEAIISQIKKFTKI